MPYERRKVIGVVDFTDNSTGRRITSVPLYEGEDLWEDTVLARGQRHVKIDRLPVGHPGSNPFNEHHLHDATRELISSRRQIQRRIVLQFAWIPKKLSEGTWVWLTHYFELQELKEVLDPTSFDVHQPTEMVWTSVKTSKAQLQHI